MDQIKTINFLNSLDFHLWEKWILGMDDTHYTDMGNWRLFFYDLYKINNYTRVMIHDKEIMGGFSVYHIRSPFLGNMLVSCPFFGFGGLYYQDSHIRDTLLTELINIGKNLNVDFIELRLSHPLPVPWQINDNYLEFEMTLNADLDTVWKNTISSNVRQNIRKSGKADFQIDFDADLNKVYPVLSETLRNHGTPFHNQHFFQLLTKYFQNQMKFVFVRKKEMSAAAAITFQFKDTVNTPYIGNRNIFRSEGSNYAQYWGITEHYHNKGVRRFNLGRSPANSTHAHFKTKWGAVPIKMYYNYMVLKNNAKYQSTIAPTLPQRLATRAWKKTPLWIIRGLGHRFFRFIP